MVAHGGAQGAANWQDWGGLGTAPSTQLELVWLSWPSGWELREICDVVPRALQKNIISAD